MSDGSQTLLKEALLLPVPERAAFAAELVASLEGEPNPAAEAAWLREIEVRVERAERGEARGTDWLTLRARLEAKHGLG